VLDGLYEHRDEIDMIVTRQEGGAAMMAAAYGQVTGKPGICMVTRGPGATNASIGVHIASQDASPMVLFVGQIPTFVEQRQAFQEVDYVQMFGGMAKEVLELREPHRATELVARALNVATSGEPGPVIVVLPENVLTLPTDAPVRSLPQLAEAQPSTADVERVAALLAESERPVILLDHVGWTPELEAPLRAFAEASRIPVVTAVRRQDLLDNASPAFAGTLGLKTTAGIEARLAEADAIVLLGARPDGLTFANAELGANDITDQRIVQVYPDADVIGRVYEVEIGIATSTAAVLAVLPEQIDGAAARQGWFDRMREAYVTSYRETAAANEPSIRAYMEAFNAHAAADAIVTVGAGNYTSWPQRHREFAGYPSMIGSASGAMGYGVPAAVAAAFEYPEREVYAFAGDGCFLMNGQELSTMHRYGLNVMVVVVNNNKYGTIRAHQDREYPGRVVGTDLENPDFIALARAYGAEARLVDSPEAFDAAMAELAGRKGLRMIEIDLTDEQ
jgi:acetolactate synthase-1/2/3 large subunit